MNEAIEVREIGNYRISIYQDTCAQCPCTDWDMVWNFLWECDHIKILSRSCNWQRVFGKYGNNKHTLDEAIIELIGDYVVWEELVQYFKDGKVGNYLLREREGTWFLKWFNPKKDVYEVIDMFGDYELNENLVSVSDLLSSLERSELLQILNDLGKDIIAKEFGSTGYSQGDYVDGVAFCTKDRFEEVASKNTDNWKEEASEYLDGYVKGLGMWMWGDVKGYILEQKENYIKYFKESDKEPEEGSEWNEIDSCWGFYMETEELIQEVIAEHELI